MIIEIEVEIECLLSNECNLLIGIHCRHNKKYKWITNTFRISFHFQNLSIDSITFFLQIEVQPETDAVHSRLL